MQLKPYFLATAVALSMAWGCTDDPEQDRPDANGATDSSVSAASADGAVRLDASSDGGVRQSDGSVDGAAPDGGALVKVSRPGQYEGYGAPVYKGYELSSLYVEVRDGTKLAVDLYRPKEANGQVTSDKLPVIWMHTPYNRRFFRATPMAMPVVSGEGYPGAAAKLIEYGYVVAVVDFRGLYASYGKNVGYNRGEWVDAARLDAYDITEWLAKQPWSSGKIGMWGCSATGGSQLQAATTAPPSLKAIFPMSCEFDAYPFGVPGGMAPPMGEPTRQPTATVAQAERNMIAQPVDGDADKAQLNAAIASQAGSVDNPGYVPFRDSVAANIPGAPWWIKSSPHTYLSEIEKSGIAVYLAVNWDEAATKYGSFFTFRNLKNPTKLVVGPASHCAWFTVQRTTGFEIAVEERRFFDHWLKGIDNGVMREPKVYYYTYNAPTGQDWTAAESWPLENEQRTPYYLSADGKLTTSAPAATAASDEKAVDYMTTPMNLAEKGITYSTGSLATDVQVTGHPVLDLWVSSTATDGDFIATLQDVAPDGTAVSYNVHGRLRASLRKTVEPPYQNLGLPYHPSNAADVQPLVPNEPVKLTFDLLPTSQVFKAGHEIRLVITFSEAPTPRLMPAPTVKLYRDAAHPSAITLPLIAR
jgi:uncharacterized protein